MFGIRPSQPDVPDRHPWSVPMSRIIITLALLCATAAGFLPAGSPAHAQAGAGPLVVVHRQPAIPLVSLRLSLLVDDPRGLAGAGHLLQHLHYDRLRTQARMVGGQVHIERTSDAIVYAVTGPATELPYLAELLKGALVVPQAATGARLAAERDLMQERLAEWETADTHLRAALRTRLFPGDLSAAGTALSAPRLSTASLEELWEKLYRQDRIAIVAVGDVETDAVEAAFAQLPAPPPPGPLSPASDTVPLAPLAPAEATRAWLGAGYRADDLDPATLSVTARLLANDLAAALPDAEVAAEHWWTHHGQAVVLALAVPPRQLGTARTRVGEAFTRLAASLNEERVADAAAAIRHDMLFYSRTPDRMAEVLGRFVDRGGDGSSAHRFYGELAEVSPEQVRELLEQLSRTRVVLAEIPPQALNVNP